jgi:hypothetical protein
VKGTVRYDRYGKITWLAEASGWVMVRRPQAIPFCMRAADWHCLPFEPGPADIYRVVNGRVLQDHVPS